MYPNYNQQPNNYNQQTNQTYGASNYASQPWIHNTPNMTPQPSYQSGIATLYQNPQNSFQTSSMYPYIPNREQTFSGSTVPLQSSYQNPINPNAQMIFQKHEINPQMIQRLQLLNQFKIVYILDDSGSMNTVDPINPQYGYNPGSNSSRWDELLQFVNTSLEIALLYNPNGCDVYFLNRQPLKLCRDLNQLRYVFQNKPQGVTPLTRTIQQVISENPAHLLQGKQLLLIIATDGEPTDMNGQPNIPEFRQCLFSRPQNVFTSIVACTNDQNSVGYLNNMDRELQRLDVVDDYRSELNEIKRARGPQYPFSYGDYIAKIFLGSIDVTTDSLDY